MIEFNDVLHLFKTRLFLTVVVEVLVVVNSKLFIVNSISITVVASHFDTLNTKIGLLFHILDTEIGWCEKKWEAGVGGGGGKHFYRIYIWMESKIW